jgi:hypothetical protein
VAESPQAHPLDPERLLRALAAHGVRYVLVGALAARLNGFPRVTADADITPARDTENLERLAAALRALDAHVWTDGVPDGFAVDCSAAMLARAEGWNLVTTAGRVDLLYRPTGVSGYDELEAEAERFDVFGVSLLVAPLKSILRMKEAADRPKDRQDAAVIRAMIDRDAASSGSTNDP